MTTRKTKKPVATWVDDDFFAEEQRAIRAVTVILRTAGCQWRHCTMCSFWQESADVTQADILAQLEHSLRTRPEFISSEKLADFDGVENLELAIGLETADDFIRANYIKKGFSFDDYKKAAAIVRDCGATVKTYLLLKPPFVSEKKALEDAIKSAEFVSEFSSTISLNLCNIQKYTPLEKLWRRGYYRPPWLWSAVEAIKAIKSRNVVVTSDPVGAGHKRGPHNCGTCDREITEAIKHFNVTQDLRVLERLDEIECDCKNVWRELMKHDAFLFNANPVLEGKRLSKEKAKM
jgi:radical SAM enzyme (TIGR01210 family)